MSEIKSFEDLECWKSCQELKQFVRKVINKLPKGEKYDLIDNIRRASRSTTRNLAEGYGRHHHQENLQFTRISRGSAYEVLDDLITAFDEGYIDQKNLQIGRDLVNKTLKLINGYIRYLEKSK